MAKPTTPKPKISGADIGLASFLAVEARRPWVWGQTDCLMTLADWVVVRRGFDPAAAFRGSYSTERECRAILEREGGLIALMSRVLKKSGILTTISPAPGDIAAVEGPLQEPKMRHGVRNYSGPAGAIITARGPAVRTIDRGLVIWQQTPVVCWSLA